MNKKQAAEQILSGVSSIAKEQGSAFAPANIALCKYWGKRDTELNLPVTSSLSVSLGELGTDTRLTPSEEDRVLLNGNEIPKADLFARRAIEFLDLFRPDALSFYRLDTTSSIPVAAGLASSASGFAALVLALDDLYQWNLDPTRQSLLARLGSGSACRSVYRGFVEWHAGRDPDGMDSFAERLDIEWPALRIGLLTLSEARKPIGSRLAMQRTVETSMLYAAWPAQVARDLEDIKGALREQDFMRLGRASESNALAMHATMMASWPPILYGLPETTETIRKIWRLREQGLPLYFTMDAGPNVKLVYLDRDEDSVRSAFGEVKTVRPFA